MESDSMNRQFCFLLLSLTVMFLRLFTLCISVVCSFVLLRSSSLHGRIPQTIILSVGGPLRCFQLEATMNKAVCDYSCTRFCAEFPVLLKKVPQSAVPGPMGSVLTHLQEAVRCSFSVLYHTAWASPVAQGQRTACQCRRRGSVPGSGRSPRESGNPPRILAWEIVWTEEPDELQSMGSQESDTT